MTQLPKRKRFHWWLVTAETSLLKRAVARAFTVNSTYERRHEISNNVVCATSKGSDQPAHTHSLIRAFASRLNILWQLSYWPNSIWSFWAEQEAAQASLSLFMSKCHIVGNHMSRLNYDWLSTHRWFRIAFSLYSNSYNCVIEWTLWLSG